MKFSVLDTERGLTNVTINGRSMKAKLKRHSYLELCEMAGKDAEVMPTITFFDPLNPCVQGTVVSGEFLTLTEGMFLNIIDTSNA